MHLREKATELLAETVVRYLHRLSQEHELIGDSDSATMESRTAEQRSRHASGTGSSYITRSMADRQGTDTYSKRYNYRSRSDVGSPRRYASQTLRSPDRSTPRGYTSDTAYDTVRSKARGGYSNYDYGDYYLLLVLVAGLDRAPKAQNCLLIPHLLSQTKAFDPIRHYRLQPVNHRMLFNSVCWRFSVLDTFSSSRHHEARTSTVGGAGAGGGVSTASAQSARQAGKGTSMSSSS
ncbi:unnamed protein product [Strongylus vulgaris]|uniref:Uncharacterized protein n=1 Tax=Strongylus vulgaris TaxID=40348 RepID=A0A3P7KM22_STRVU|nr:unnamed protein product [Strongylus vulgaris]